MFLVYNLEGFFLLSMFMYHLIRRRTGYISVQICSVVGVFITQSSAYLPMATVYFFSFFVPFFARQDTSACQQTSNYVSGTFRAMYSFM